MPLKSSRVAGLYLSLTIPLALITTTAAQRTPSLLPDTWSGRIHCDNESTTFILRLAQGGKDSLAMFWALPEANHREVGPIPLTQQGGEFKATFSSFAFSAHLAPDSSTMTGLLSFDGHALPFDLARGAPPPSTPASLPGGLAPPGWAMTLLSLALVAPTTRARWTVPDYALVGASVALHVADWSETAWALRHGSSEANPLLGAHPSQARLAATDLAFLALYGFAEVKLPRDVGRALALLDVTLEAFTIINNQGSGTGPR